MSQMTHPRVAGTGTLVVSPGSHKASHASGASIEPRLGQVFKLFLRSPDEAGLVMPPERKCSSS